MVDVLGRVAVVIEDDENIRDLITVILEKIGLEVIAVGDAADGIETVRERQPAIVTLDINLPGIDGFEAAQRIRAISQAYVVMITARDEEIDTLQGLGAGADDYVVKPFRPRELRARVEAMLRRPRAMSGPVRFVPPHASATGESLEGSVASNQQTSSEHVHSDTPASSAPQNPHSGQGEHWLTHNGLRLEPDSRLVELDGVDIVLTQSEFDLLCGLMESGRRVRDKSDLALLLRSGGYITNDYVCDADRRTVEVHVSNLRRKLGEASAHPRIIETVRGIGYRLTASEDLWTRDGATT